MKLSVRIVFHSLTVNAGSQDGGGGGEWAMGGECDQEVRHVFHGR